MLLASCSCDDALKYRNKLVLVSNEDKKKPEEVWLNIFVEDNMGLEEVFMKGMGVAKCITTVSSPERDSIPEKFRDKVFRIYRYKNDYGNMVGDHDDFSLIDEEKNGVIPLIVLPDGFCDMKYVYNLSLKYPQARFMGGNLLEIPGLKIGRFDDGKEKMSAVFNGVYDVFREVSFDDIKVQEVMSKVRSKSSNGSRPKSSVKRVTPKAKKSEAFSRFFGGEENEF